jgi:hypothetical protein
MPNLEVPPFDLLENLSHPFSGFSEVLPSTPDLEDSFRRKATTVRLRIAAQFGVPLKDWTSTAKELDSIVAGMWGTGWNPETGNVNLFACDFGLVLSEAILGMLHGTPTFRSKTDLSHFSIYWPEHRLEAFPFHKVLKCLYNKEGERMIGFVDGLTGKVQGRHA